MWDRDQPRTSNQNKQGVHWLPKADAQTPKADVDVPPEDKIKPGSRPADCRHRWQSGLCRCGWASRHYAQGVQAEQAVQPLPLWTRKISSGTSPTPGTPRCGADYKPLSPACSQICCYTLGAAKKDWHIALIATGVYCPGDRDDLCHTGTLPHSPCTVLALPPWGDWALLCADSVKT